MSPKSKPTGNDLELRYKPLLGERTAAERAFPTVESLSITGEREGDGVEEYARRVHMDLCGLEPYIPCRNPQCYGGGFHIHNIIYGMIEFKEMHKEIASMYCEGHDGNSRKRGDPCFNRLRKILISIRFRDPARSPSAPPAG